MKCIRGMIVASVLVSVVGLSMWARSQAPGGMQMADAASNFLEQLAPEQRDQTLFPIDSKERLNWHFIPMQDRMRQPTRKGIGLFRLNEAQQKAMMALLRTGTSAKGFAQAETIMGLEAILHELEKGGGSVRDPKWYFLAIFGKPSKTGKWGWRIEGHHLSVNFLIDQGEIVATTPLFFGANPAVIKTGERKGERILPRVERLARDLFVSLAPDQQKSALQPKHFPEIKQQPQAEVGEPVGLPAAQMTEAQQTTLRKLLRAYANRMPAKLARREMQRIRQGGFDKIYFAFTGSPEPGKPHTYRIQGPTFVVEFLNLQADSLGNPANHVHSVWRHLPADLGLPG